MKRVDATEILGNPESIDRQVACPGCHGRAVAFEDGSVVCVAEGGVCYAPEAGDGELFEMRRAFDTARGITPADRLIVPTALKRGVTPNMPALHERYPHRGR